MLGGLSIRAYAFVEARPSRIDGFRRLTCRRLEPPGEYRVSHSLLLAAAGAACITVLASGVPANSARAAFSAVTGNLALFGVAYLGAFTGVTIALDQYLFRSQPFLEFPA